MKKFIIVALAALAFTANANAQYGPKKGNFSTEISFNPFANNFNTFELSRGQVKGVYFLNDKNALRFGLGFDIDADKTRANLNIPTLEDYDNEDIFDMENAKYELLKDNYTKETKTKFNVVVGWERHFKTVDRLDLYAGAQVGLGFSWNNVSTEDNFGTYNPEKKVMEKTYVEKTSLTTGTSNVALGVFTGINYYVWKSLYLGAEIGVGCNFHATNNATSNWETTDPKATVKSGSHEVNVKDNEIAAQFRCEPALHLGWTF